MKYKVQLPKKSTCRATSDILYIYCMIAREIWRFTPPGKIIFPERNMIFLGEYIFIYLPNVRALNCSLYLTTGDNLEYIGFQSFFNSCKALTVVNVYRFLSLSVFWFKKGFKRFFLIESTFDYIVCPSSRFFINMEWKFEGVRYDETYDDREIWIFIPWHVIL